MPQKEQCAEIDLIVRANTESKMEARNAVAKRLNKIYDRRSEIVHSGKHEVSSEDLQDAIQFCVRSLFEILTFAASWGNTQDAGLKRLAAQI
jgi:hypothetical protein